MDKFRLDADLLSVQSFPTAAAQAAARANTPARDAAPRRKPLHPGDAVCTCWPCNGAA